MRKAALLIALLFFGCSKKNGETTTVSSDVTGTWNWVFQSNDGMWAGNWSGPPYGDTLTPQSTGVQETLTFNTNGTYVVVDNGRTVRTGMYKIDTVIVPGPLNGGGPMPFLAFVQPGRPDSLVNHWVSHDSLYIVPMLITTVAAIRIYVRSDGVENPE